jgi:PAS domain S-box-containing protein
MSQPETPPANGLPRGDSLLSSGDAAAALALRLIGVGTWEVDCGGDDAIDSWPMRWSMETCRILGVEPTEAPQSRNALRAHIHTDDRALRDTVADRAWRAGAPYSAEFRIQRGDGVVRHLIEQAHVFIDPVSGLRRIFGVFQDVTDRRQTDQALRGYNLLLRGITRAQTRFISGRARSQTFGELLTCLVSFTGSEFGYIGEREKSVEGDDLLNLWATAGTGWEAPIREYYSGHPQIGSVMLAQWESQVNLEKGPFICNTPDAADGTSNFLPGHPPVTNFILVPFAHENGARGVIGLANASGGYSPRLPQRLDALLNTAASLLWAYRATERRQQAEAELININTLLEDRVRQRTAELEAANNELESFSYSVSHDLRAPLRGIDGWSLALTEDYSEELPEQARAYLGQVREEVQHMGRLIEDLLEMARVTRVDVVWRDIDLSALASSVVTTLCRRLPDREIEVVIAPSVRGRGDPGLLRVVLQNLLDNAWKFTSALEGQARVEFGVMPKLNQTVYFVRDNGAGFDMNYAGKLFSPFRRLHRQNEFPGTGIGLATVHRIIRRHGGTIWAESSPGEGATFFFTLPEPS